MNSVHDMGGLQGFGPVLPEADEPLFHADWERRALALTVAAGATGMWNIDLSRSARESLSPAIYLNASYYEIWLRALEKMLIERGLVRADELARGQMLAASVPVARVPGADAVAAALAAGTPADRPARSQALFAPGDRVRARNLHPLGHTRLPRYVRGHVGTIERVHGAHIYPDRHASHALPPFDQTPEWLYGVVFDGRELWGEGAQSGLSVNVDAWEPYLEAAVETS
ncbi:MAG: nitrile hydratase subunit beta [Burkholderiales bacterium]